MMGGLVDSRLAFAVGAKVRRAVGRFWVGPEVRCLAHVIVFVSARRRSLFVNNGRGPGRKHLLRFALELRPCRRQILIAGLNPLSSNLQLPGIKEKDSRSEFGMYFQ